MTTRVRALRPILALLSTAAVLVTIVSAHLYREQKTGRAELIQILAEAGLDERSPRLASLVRADPDVIATQERVALALVADLLDPSSRADAPTPGHLEQELARQVERLDVAEQLGHAILETRPSSWRASTAIGAAIYLRRSLRRDEQLVRSYRDWEAPLLRARRIAPNRSEPARFLTMAYLELWPVVTAEKRELTRSMLASSLRDRNTYLATIEAWLQVAGDELETIDLLPQSAWLLGDLRKRLLRRGHLALALESHRRWAVATAEEADAAIEVARAASARGDHTRAAKLLIAELNGLPAQLRWLPLAERLLASVPSGQLRREGPIAHRWFDFELEQCLRSACRLSEGFVGRILPVSGRGTRDQLVAALSNGDDAEMARWEAEIPPEARCSEPFARYWLAKATQASRSGDLGTARKAATECIATQSELALAQGWISRAVRRGSGLHEVETPMLGDPHRQGQEFAFPPGAYELTLEFPDGNAASLFDLLVDGDQVASVAVSPSGATHSIRVTTTGSAQFLRAARVAGAGRSPEIVGFSRKESPDP